MAPYQLLGALGLALVISEIFIPGFILLPAGVAFLMAAFVGLLTDSWYVLLPVLGAFELFAFLVLRNWLGKLAPSRDFQTNADSMVGQKCEVIEAIRPQQAGYVKLYGDQWVARSEHLEEIGVGRKVKISRVEGNKVWVTPF